MQSLAMYFFRGKQEQILTKSSKRNEQCRSQFIPNEDQRKERVRKGGKENGRGTEGRGEEGKGNGREAKGRERHVRGKEREEEGREAERERNGVALCIENSSEEALLTKQPQVQCAASAEGEPHRETKHESRSSALSTPTPWPTEIKINK